MILNQPLTIGLLIAALVGIYTWRSLASRLRKIPGPFAALFTSWILKAHELQGLRTRYIHGLHLKYGPVVRIAPNEVSFASMAAIKEIYSSGGSGYDKTEFYDLFKVFGRRTMFTMLKKEDHAKRRRVIADRYANSNVLRPNALDGIKVRSARFLDMCAATVGGSFDIFIALHSYAMDGATHHLFHPYGSDALRSSEDEKIMRQVVFDDSLQNRLIKFYIPSLHWWIDGAISMFAKPRDVFMADDLVLRASEKSDPAQFTLLSRMQEKSQGMEVLDMAAECLDHMAAGIDTTGDGLCFLMWEISQPSSMHVQRRLQKELLENPDTPSDRLPYLDAVINEGLRCFPPIPMSLPRYVPDGGRTIDGYFVPGGTIVSSQPYSAHRIDTTVFPQPELFNPDRWLEPTGDADRKRLLFAFASGGRSCIGRHVAMAEMRTLLKDVYSRFTTVPDSSMTVGDMEMSDQLISSQPKGQKCLLRFLPNEDQSAGGQLGV